jgi:hypothetical protein
MTRAQKPEADALYIALDSFLYHDGTSIPATVQDGTRLRGNHPAVQKHPHLFARDGQDDETLRRARQDLRRAGGSA